MMFTLFIYASGYCTDFFKAIGCNLYVRCDKRINFVFWYYGFWRGSLAVEFPIRGIPE